MKRSIFFKVAPLVVSVLCSFSIKANSYFYQGGAITTLSSWNSLANGTGTVPVTFTGSHTWTFGNAASSAALAASWGISGTAIVNIGDATNAFSLTLNSGAAVGTSNTQINIKNNATLIDNASYGFNISKTNPNTGSTMVFASSGSQILAYTNPYYNLIIASDVGLNAVNITVNGTLTINAGCSLSLNNLNLIINNRIAGAGEFVGDNGGSSGITFNSVTGSVGTLRFQAGSEYISNLTLNLGSSSSSVTLGSNLIIDGSGFGSTANFNTGILALNGSSLQFSTDCAADFSGGGELLSTSSSVLEVDNTVTGGLTFNSSGNSIKALIINSTGNTVSLSNALNIVDSLSVLDGTFSTGGNLTIKCSSGSVGRVSRIGASGSLTGNVTMESFFPAGSTGWGLCGTPGINGVTFANFDSQYPMSCSGCTYGQTGTGGWFNSVQGWDEANSTMDTNIVASTGLTPGKGFFLYSGTGSTSSNSMLWSFTGSAVQGNVNMSTSSSGTNATYMGVNLVANPYPSPISWEALYNNSTNGANFATTVYYWKRNSGAAATYQVGGSQTGGGTDVIPPGQGFFVENNSFSTANLVFDESVKTSANTTNLYRPSASGKSSLSYVRLRVTGFYDTDDALVLLNPSANDGHDRYDASKMFSSPGYGGGQTTYSKYTTISSQELQTNRYLAQNSLPPSSKDRIIPVLVQVSTSGSYTLTADEFVNYPSCAVIHDKLTNAFIDLRVQPSYVFNISDTTQTPRFELYVCANGGAAVSVNELYASSNISIGKDAEGPVVKTNFEQPTDAIISVYNILGQQLVNDIKVNGAQTTTHLNNLNLHNQVVVVKVTAGDKSITKKLLID